MGRAARKSAQATRTLAESWLEGVCDHRPIRLAVEQTQAELKAAGITEAEARAMRDKLERVVFDQWRREHQDFAYPSSSDLWMLTHGARYWSLILLCPLYGRDDLAFAGVLLLAEAAAGRFKSARELRSQMHMLKLERFSVEEKRAETQTQLDRVESLALQALTKIVEARRASKTGGKQSAEKRREKADKTAAAALEHARRLMKSDDVDPRTIAGIVARKAKRSPAWARDVLTKAGLREKKRK